MRKKPEMDEDKERGIWTRGGWKWTKWMKGAQSPMTNPQKYLNFQLSVWQVFSGKLQYFSD
jgi:hypothetical protein